MNNNNIITLSLRASWIENCAFGAKNLLVGPHPRGDEERFVIFFIPYVDLICALGFDVGHLHKTSLID